MTRFKPMLGSDIKEPSNLSYPLLMSKKLDGIRCIFTPDGHMISRSLKFIPNNQLQEKFAFLKELAKKEGCYLDGELYHHDLSFQQITALVMTQDFDNEKTYKKIEKNDDMHLGCHYFNKKFDNPIQFHLFDVIYPTNLQFDVRVGICSNLINQTNKKSFVNVSNILVYDWQDVQELYNDYLKQGYEGAILRNPKVLYKFGRSTEKEQGLLKLKQFITFDAIVRDVLVEQESTAEQERNELGNSKRSHKKEFMIDTNKASCLLVKYKGHDVKVQIALPDEERKRILKFKDNYIGKWIEYKGMLVGAKDVPRHPVFLRFRDDK